MHYCARQIRAALGDRAQDPRFIVTIPRRGYRLKADALVRATRVQPSASSSPRLIGWRRGLALAGLTIALAGATAAVEQRPNNHHEIAVVVLKTVHDFVF